jgi:hypothetical protein
MMIKARSVPSMLERLLKPEVFAPDFACSEWVSVVFLVVDLCENQDDVAFEIVAHLRQLRAALPH